MGKGERGWLWSAIAVLAVAIAGCSTHASGKDGAPSDAPAADHSTAVDSGGQPDRGGVDADGGAAASDADRGDGADGAATFLGPIVGMPVATFDTTTEGFQLSTYHD